LPVGYRVEAPGVSNAVPRAVVDWRPWRRNKEMPPVEDADAT